MLSSRRAPGGALDPQIGRRHSWERAGEAAAALLARQVRGNAVLEVSGGESLVDSVA